MTPMTSLTRGLAARNAVFTTRPLPVCRKPLARRHLYQDAGIIGQSVLWTSNQLAAFHHAIGIPWFVTIPLFALVTSGLFRLPCQIMARELASRRKELQPLVIASNVYNSSRIPRDYNNGSLNAWKESVAKLTKKSQRDIYRSFGVQRYKSAVALLPAVPALIVIESLRILCGSPHSWLLVYLGLASGPQSAQSLVGSSLVDGGCLWFSDLTAMDPYFILPIFCTSLIARGVWTKLPQKTIPILLGLGDMGPISSMSARQRAFGRTMLLAPLLPLAVADLPSAIMLFWASSLAISGAMDWKLRRRFPKRGIDLTTKPKVTQFLPYIPRDHKSNPSKQK
ncbi:hypothetical protein CDD82_1603 [Ophiocordyceps australis]|uniref:Mitochondrial export translocase Oxa2 n=1 Tax=Ophiocordyceps australis TaxID=1399860 RepID=A0A2C5ZV88_9HYPO|nr:hypothetical protein CDD82_1603 [Ophiocordyceps australis]